MELYEKYSAIDKEITLLEEQKKGLRKEIEESLPEEGVKNDFVTAFWAIKKKWAYSSAIESLSENLKSAKEKEEEDGTAKFEETKQLTIKVK